MDVKDFRKKSLRELTNEVGVYALCDLDQKPIYIGQSIDGIRTRVRRHLTSARSDVIANRQLDVWEISEVWAWPLDNGSKQEISALESHLIHHYNNQRPLVNGKIPAHIGQIPEVPHKQVVKILEEYELLQRQNPIRRLPRQMQHLSNLFSHILEVKNNPEQRRMLRVHFQDLKAYYEEFMKSSGEIDF